MDFIYRELFGSLWYMPYYFAGVFTFIALTLYARVCGNVKRHSGNSRQVWS